MKNAIFDLEKGGSTTRVNTVFDYHPCPVGNLYWMCQVVSAQTHVLSFHMEKFRGIALTFAMANGQEEYPFLKAC